MTVKRHVYFVSYHVSTEDGRQLFGNGAQRRDEPITSWDHVIDLGHVLTEALKREVEGVKSCIILNWQLLRVED